MRRWLRRGGAELRDRREDMIAELERWPRRAAAVLLAAPLLLFGGFGLGKLATRALALPEDVALLVPTGERVPRAHLERLGRHMEELREHGERTEERLVLYRDHVAPVEDALRRRGVAAVTARAVAWPLVEHAYRHGLDPSTVLSVLLIESGGRPRATSPVGARGLMQVMPHWTGRWRECGRDLYDIESNLCYGTRILAWYLKRYRGDERRALLGYNGCVRGTNTPNCFDYPERVARMRRQIRAEWRARLQSGAPVPVPSASGR